MSVSKLTKTKTNKKPKENTMKNSTARTVGRPPKTPRWPRTAFTVNSVFTFNQKKICKLTLRNKIEEGLASKKLVKLAKNVERDTAGRPAFRFMLKNRVQPVRKAKTVKASTTATIPVINPVPVAQAA